MDNRKVASELLKMAKDLVAADSSDWNKERTNIEKKTKAFQRKQFPKLYNYSKH